MCFDEKPVQLVAEIQAPRPVAPGQPQLFDYEYKRNGTANIFMAVEPLAGWRQVTVTAQRTMRDFAAQMQELVDVTSALSSTTSTPTSQPASTRPSRRRKPAASCGV